jgi:hypothetical protein
MNYETGKIKEVDKAEWDEIILARSEKINKLIPINLEDATNKQKTNMQVSLHDNRSVLGKLRVKTRREKLTDKELERIQEQVTKIVERMNKALVIK